MDNINSVTIPLDQYVDLLERAKMNGFLMNELGRMDARFQEIDRRLYDLEVKKRHENL